jgi:hypothetical protein
MDALAAEAFLNAEHTVCGLRMRPLSLGHAFTLEAIASPFYKGELGNEEQLRMAAWICSRPALQIPKMRTLACRLWKLRPISLVDETLNWTTYVADYCAPPQLWNKTMQANDAKHEPSRIPSVVNTAVKLMRLGMSEQQAWATPVGMASWYEAAAFENDTGSHLDIVTDAERIAIAKVKARKPEENV